MKANGEIDVEMARHITKVFRQKLWDRRKVLSGNTTRSGDEIAIGLMLFTEELVGAIIDTYDELIEIEERERHMSPQRRGSR